MSLTCPANIQVTGASTPVSFSMPTPSGGVPPYTITCSPPSGSNFPVGTTIVSCRGTDAAARPAACYFTVTFVPVLGATKFVTFGDSITNGEVQTNVAPTDVERQNSYPTQLLGMLTRRYLSQSFNVINAGVSGESAVDGATRLPGVLASANPQVLLLLQGVIDLGGGFDLIPPIIAALRSDIDHAKARGTIVFVSTLLPQKHPISSSFEQNNGAMPYLSAANEAIRALAASENVTLVDAYSAFLAADPTLATLIGGDGLHPTVQGYTQLASVFYDAIRAKLEVSAGASSVSASGRLRLAPANIKIRPQTQRQPIGTGDRQE